MLNKYYNLKRKKGYESSNEESNKHRENRKQESSQTVKRPSKQNSHKIWYVSTSLKPFTISKK